jgi:hypothetical protein
MRGNPKSEPRNPKEARSPKPEKGSSARPWPFGFRSSDSLRISDFGVRILPVAAVLALLLSPGPAPARINVVTLPGRDTVQLTIYNSADLTLVKETRVLTFRKGLNRLEFSWANTLIDPTSVEFRALSHADAVDVLDVSFPPRVTNTLEWRIQSGFAGEVKVEIRYFTSGISWSADYVAEASKDEKQMTLAGNVRVNNRSGEDYEDTQVRLVVGVVRLIDAISFLAKGGKDAAKERLVTNTLGVLADQSSLSRRSGLKPLGAAFGLMESESLARKKEVVKEEMGEYFLYTVEGRDTIPDGWSKRLPSFSAPNVPVTSYYKFEKERWGDAVRRFYRFTNSVPSKLGKEPLPDGAVKAFRTVSADDLLGFVGSTSVKYIPLNETVEMDLGGDRELLVKPRLMNWEKKDITFDANGNVKGWTTKETWEFEIQNSKDIDVVLDIRRNFGGDWTLATEAGYEKVDAHKVKFVRPLKPREKQTFAYEVTTRQGTNATR